MTHKYKIKDDVRTDDLPADTFRNVPAAKPEDTQEGAEAYPQLSVPESVSVTQSVPPSPVLNVGAECDLREKQPQCTMTEVRYLFSQEVRRMRLEHGYEDVYALSRACTRLGVGDLMKLETGLFEGFASIIALSRFYGKKVRIVFY